MMDMKVKPTQLCEKAMLVKLTMRRANLSKRDTAAEAMIQNQLGDDSLVVSSKLFRDKLNPVNRLVSYVGELYTYHKSVTLPYCDKGPRIIPNAMYLEYCAAMKERIATIDAKMAEVLPNWDMHVAADIAWRSKSTQAQRAHRDDYPSAEQFKERLGFDLRFMPLPDTSHFLFDVSEEDKAGFAETMAEVARNARNDAIRRMLEPTQHLVSKLSVQIGEPGGIFRDSALSNVVEGIELARKLNIDADPEIETIIAEVAKVVTKLNTGKDLVREHAPTREAAAKKLAELDAKMRSYMSGG
jgi:hypothetical protein